MRTIKSERLKKLESELIDLERWLNMNLVPKKDIPKHKEEIKLIKEKIEEEKQRLQFLKESGDLDEYAAPKRPSPRAYTDMPSMPDVDSRTSHDSLTEGGVDTESVGAEEEEEEEEDDEREEDADNQTDADMEDDESYFSDRNRWKRGGRNGGILDPDANEW